MIKRSLAVVATSLLSAPVFATAPAFPDVAGGVDFTAVGTQAGVLALALVGVYVIMKGGKLLLNFLRSS